MPEVVASVIATEIKKLLLSHRIIPGMRVPLLLAARSLPALKSAQKLWTPRRKKEWRSVLVRQPIYLRSSRLCDLDHWPGWRMTWVSENYDFAVQGPLQANQAALEEGTSGATAKNACTCGQALDRQLCLGGRRWVLF